MMRGAVAQRNPSHHIQDPIVVGFAALNVTRVIAFLPAFFLSAFDSIFTNDSEPSRRSREFTDFDSRPLDFRHPPRRYSMPSCSQRASTGGACWRSGMWRLRMSLANSSPGASGDTARPNYVGPSGNGLVERMKAGESPWNQGRSNGRPCPFPEGGPEDEGKRRSGAPRGAPVRVMDRQFPPAGGTGPTARRATGCGVPHQRLSALRSL